MKFIKIKGGIFVQYRKFGPIDYEASTLGFGAMRFPTIDNDPKQINEGKAISMIRYAIDHGINYVDTAYPYHGGNSEFVVGKALKDGYRQKTKLATKFPIWLPKTHQDCDKYLEKQLQKLDVESIDFYLIHGLNKERWQKVLDLDVLGFLQDAQRKGKIHYIGFSFHDDLELFREIIDFFDWDFCQIQFNYMDEHYQAGLEGLKYAASKNIPLVIMEPLQGGNLTKEPPEDIKRIWNQADIKRTPAQWGFRWVCNHPEVKVVLSGMSTMEQLQENIETFENALPNSLTEKELELIGKVRDKYKEKMKVRCTECKYCMPCPNGVNIPQNFKIYNRTSMYQTLDEYQRSYENLEKEKASASSCVKCGKCEKVCPQRIPIINKLKEVNKVLGK